MVSGANRSNPASTGVWVVKTLPARVTDNRVEGSAVIFHPGPRTLQHRERGVAFVQVQELGLNAQRAQETASGNPEDLLLLESGERVPAVELARDAAMLGEVR